MREPYRQARRVQCIRQRTGSTALPSVARNFPVAQELIRAGLVFRVESSAVNTAGAVAGLHGRSPLLRLQSDERLIALIRRGNQHAFEALVARYQSRLLAFCRHMLSS